MKKGDIKISHFIAGIVAIVVLFIVLMGIYYQFTGKLIPFFNFLPNFNKTIDAPDTTALVRYSIQEAKVQYYDGTEWQDFEEIKSKNSVIKANSLKEDFENWYYKRNKEVINLNHELRNIFALINTHNPNLITEKELKLSYIKESRSQGKMAIRPFTFYVPTIVKIGPGYVKDFDMVFFPEDMSNEEISRQAGEISFLLVKEDNIEESPGVSFSLDLNNKFSIVYPQDESGKRVMKEISSYQKSDFLSLIYNAAKNWRDSIFQKPIPINAQNNKEYYCTSLYDKKYIVLNLNAPVDKSQQCNLP